MGINTTTNFNYDKEYITCLLKEVEEKIAFVTNRDYKNSIYNLALQTKATDYTDLIDVSNILSKILNCNSCYNCADIKIEDVISMVKSKLNNC